jgi:hypothetical protein
MKIAVVTAAVGLDTVELYQPKPTVTSSHVDYFIFSDSEIPKHHRWKSRKLFLASRDEYYEHRRTAKLPKIMTHYLLPEYDYYIWHDYTHRISLDPEEIVETYLKDNDFAFFKHPHRDSWDSELEEVRKGRLDHTSLLDEQRKHFEGAGIEKAKNFYECTCFIRRNSEKANKTCSLWYDYVSKFSSRDQLSLPAALQRYAPKVTTMPGTCQMYYGNNEIIPQYRHSLRIQGLVK